MTFSPGETTFLFSKPLCFLVIFEDPKMTIFKNKQPIHQGPSNLAINDFVLVSGCMFYSQNTLSLTYNVIDLSLQGVAGNNDE